MPWAGIFPPPATRSLISSSSPPARRFYALYAGALALVFDDRARRLLLAEAMRGFASYLRAKAALYNPDTDGPAAFRSLIDAYAALVDRLQAARDAIFSRRRSSDPEEAHRLPDRAARCLRDHAVQRRGFRIAAPVSRRRDLKWRINAFILLIADEIESIDLALRSRHAECRATSAQERGSRIDAMRWKRPIATSRKAKPSTTLIYRHRQQAGAWRTPCHGLGPDVGPPYAAVDPLRLNSILPCFGTSCRKDWACWSSNSTLTSRPCASASGCRWRC